MWTTRQGRLAVVFAVLAAAAWWLTRGLTEAPTPRVRARAPDHIVWDFKATETDTTGLPQRRLSAAQLRQFVAEDLTELDRPHLTLFERDSGPPWEIRAEQGYLVSRGEEVQLREQVTIDHEGAADARPFHLTTEELRLWPKREYAQGDLPVRLASAGDWLTAAGLRLWYAHPARAEFPGRAHIFIAPATTAPGPSTQADR